MTKIKRLDSGDVQVCEDILRSLPDWFGIESSLKDYVKHSKNLPMLIAQKDGRSIGFLSIKTHSAFCAEIYVMGVLPEYHKQGAGSLLITAAEENLSQNKIEFLQVKTLSEDRENSFYKKTRLFYKAQGFKEIEVFPNLWGESNPCLLLLKTIESAGGLAQ